MGNTDYRRWRQDDPEYNQTVAWPASEYPDARLHTFAECGCLVTALAVMLRRHNRIPENEIEGFTPRTFCDQLKRFGAFDSVGNLRTFLPIEYRFKLKYCGSFEYSREALEAAARDNGMMILKVAGKNAPYHYICLDEITPDDAVIIDSASDKRHLSEFETVYSFFRFTDRYK